MCTFVIEVVGDHHVHLSLQTNTILTYHITSLCICFNSKRPDHSTNCPLVQIKTNSFEMIADNLLTTFIFFRENHKILFLICLNNSQTLVKLATKKTWIHFLLK